MLWTFLVTFSFSPLTASQEKIFKYFIRKLNCLGNKFNSEVSVLLVLRLPRLGKRELILMLFVRLFGSRLFRFVGFLFHLGSGKGCGLWLWHSLDFSLTCFGTKFICNEEDFSRNIFEKRLSKYLQWDSNKDNLHFSSYKVNVSYKLL